VAGKTGEDLTGAVKQPVIMQHGLIDDGGTWFFNDATLDLSLELVDMGYDIWATNNRGTVFSNRHLNFTVDDAAFWNFTMNEMGKYDVPANIDYVLAHSLGKFDQVIWFGHSQGTAQWFIANALDEKLAAKFKAFIGLAPVMYVYNQNSVLVTTLSLLEVPDLLSQYFNSFLYVPWLSSISGPFLHAFPRFIWNIVQTMVGFDKQQHFDFHMLPMMGRNDVGGTSMKNLMHWIQMVRAGYFRQYDYGSAAANQIAYGSDYPPQYNTAHFKTNLAHVSILFFVGGNDALVNSADYAKLLPLLPGTVKSKVITDYNHLDCMWSADVNEYVNDDVRAFLKSL
jgi:pimeloyl-ACP methyl ester carboxylesterase